MTQAQKVFFNLFKDQKKEGEYFVSHPSNGAKGSANKGVSKNGNDILIFDLQVEGLHLKGVFNKAKPGGLPNAPQIWAECEDGGKTYRLAGWYTTTKKNGEAVKTPYFSCSAQEKVNQDADAPAQSSAATADNFDAIPF